MVILTAKPWPEHNLSRKLLNSISEHQTSKCFEENSISEIIKLSQHLECIVNA